jgi:hypothetical protein
MKHHPTFDMIVALVCVAVYIAYVALAFVGVFK